jgi:hypothetical protein
VRGALTIFISKRVLALDQVLRKRWSCLTIFWDFDRLVKDRVPRQSEDCRISPHFMGFLGFRAYVTGMGFRPMGLTHV